MKIRIPKNTPPQEGLFRDFSASQVLPRLVSNERETSVTLPDFQVSAENTEVISTVKDFFRISIEIKSLQKICP